MKYETLTKHMQAKRSGGRAMSKVIEYHNEASKINQDTKFQEMKDFVHTLCPLPYHWCNGQPIKNLATIKLQPCQYYIPKKGCMHPENPKNKEKQANNDIANERIQKALAEKAVSE